MVFSSLNFLLIFLPIVLLLYYCLSNIIVKNGLLFIVSLIFYALGEPYYIVLLLISSFVNYLFAKSIDNDRKKTKLVFAIIFNIGILFIFKYLGFFLSILNSIGINIPQYELRLPIGISFFTFQIMSYVIDVYKEKEKAEKNYFNVLLYISFFPQLIAGPIVKYHDISNQIKSRNHSIEKFAEGLHRFIIGLSKKVILSNNIAIVVDSIYALESSDINFISAWIAAILYCFQIYFDFSGYSDMAIGLGKIFGFDFRENFNYPLASTGMKEFWRKWHISLSSWFKEYLYIPLGGNRISESKTIINKFIVFFCTGIWHGANYTFVLWGLLNGVFVILEEKIDFLKKLNGKVIGWIYTFMAVSVCFVLFRSDTLSQAINIYYNMFFNWASVSDGISNIIYLFDQFTILMITISFIGIFKWKNIINMEKIENLKYVFSIVLLIISIMLLTTNSYNPFIYFRF